MHINYISHSMKIYTSVAINNEKRCKKTTGRIDSVKTLEIEKINVCKSPKTHWWAKSG